ncbi:MAG: hypothetical protein IJV15_05535 [Lachnospiraceae bacterium]|nr:hypothetical protein [Lachnospiraceae bacterium]
MGYTEREIIKMCDMAMDNIATFYQQDFINYRGKASDTDEYYTEIIAEYILQHIENFRTQIPVITRSSSYDQNHEGTYKEGTGRDEEVIAIKMFLQSNVGAPYDYIGKIIDYQTPLKSKKSDVAGKIDLLSYDGHILRVLELKKASSDETMLRCVLEGYTYLCTVDVDKLLADFKLPPNTEVCSSPFVFRNGKQWEEWAEKRPMLMELMDKLDSKPFFIESKEGKYKVTED